MIATRYGKNYLSVLGYACVNPEFRIALLRDGAQAVLDQGLPVELSDEDREHLDDFPEADEMLAKTWDDAGVQINRACGNPPCPYFGYM